MARKGWRYTSYTGFVIKRSGYKQNTGAFGALTGVCDGVGGDGKGGTGKTK